MKQALLPNPRNFEQTAVAIQYQIFFPFDEPYAYARICYLDEEEKLVKVEDIVLTEEDLAFWGEDDSELTKVILEKLDAEA